MNICEVKVKTHRTHVEYLKFHSAKMMEVNFLLLLFKLGSWCSADQSVIFLQ